MGTNYYLLRDTCPHCGRGEDKLHIGKSSAGWCFSLHVYPEDGICNLDDWRKEFSKAGVSIADEYGDVVPADEMLKTITERHWPAQDDRTPEYLARNYAIDGPNNLMRYAIGHSCIGHGEGTWDCLTGYFS